MGKRQVRRPITQGPKKVPMSLKPQRTRQIIRRFHTLLKQRTEILRSLGISDENLVKKGLSRNGLEKLYNESKRTTMKTIKLKQIPTGDHRVSGLDEKGLAKLLGAIDGEIEKRGGLEVYQMASIKGQHKERGGDSSKKLIDWMKELKIEPHGSALEIGCLSSKNYISTCGYKMTRIDLNSQEPGTIEKQDFLERPLPKSATDKFDLVSCSLVVNFVPDPKDRGEMLRRITMFLKEPTERQPSLLFFVIPLPCIENSRYCTKDTVDTLLGQLGFKTLKYQASSKLAYWLCSWQGSAQTNLKYKLTKRELRQGSNRNNFTITLT